MFGLRLPVLLTALLLFLAIVPGPCLAEDGLALKIATLSPEGTSLVQGLRDASDAIKEKTGGRVFLKLYTGGVMGNDSVVLRKMRMGQLQGGFLAAGELGKVSKGYGILGMPMLFDNYAEADAVRQAVEPKLIAGLEKDGYVSFGLLEIGFVYIMSNRPLKTLEDIQGCKPWNPEGNELGQEIFEALQATPIPLPVPDVATALQTGLVDTVFNSPVATLALQWFTKVDYLTRFPLLYSYGSLILSEQAWKQISPEDQAVVSETLAALMRDLNVQSRKDNEAAAETLRKQGIEFLDVAPGEADKLRALCATIIESRRERGLLDPAMLEQIQSILKGVRGN